MDRTSYIILKLDCSNFESQWTKVWLPGSVITILVKCYTSIQWQWTTDWYVTYVTCYRWKSECNGSVYFSNFDRPGPGSQIFVGQLSKLGWLIFIFSTMDQTSYIILKLRSTQLRKLANDSLVPWTWSIEVEWIANSVKINPSLITYNTCCMLHTAYTLLESKHYTSLFLSTLAQEWQTFVD